jgi:DNA invertase Pin-like site-specific DNA recombinase
MSITNVAIYVRVSTDRQAKKGDSIDEQLSTCKAYIASKENMVLAGTTLTMESPAGKSNVEILSSCLMMSGSDA